MSSPHSSTGRETCATPKAAAPAPGPQAAGSSADLQKMAQSAGASEQETDVWQWSDGATVLRR